MEPGARKGSGYNSWGGVFCPWVRYFGNIFQQKGGASLHLRQVDHFCKLRESKQVFRKPAPFGTSIQIPSFLISGSQVLPIRALTLGWHTCLCWEFKHLWSSVDLTIKSFGCSTVSTPPLPLYNLPNLTEILSFNCLLTTLRFFFLFFFGNLSVMCHYSVTVTRQLCHLCNHFFFHIFQMHESLLCKDIIL